MKIEELQRSQLQIEQVLRDIRAAKAAPPSDNNGSRSNPQLRRRTPPPAQTDEASRTPRSEMSSRNSRSQVDPSTTDASRMVRSSTTPDLATDAMAEAEAFQQHKFKRYRDDPRYKETGKQYGPWPPYPDWQDLPLRRFGMGFGKKGVKAQGYSGGTSSMKPGGATESDYAHLKDDQHGDLQLVGGLQRGIGYGRRKYDHVNVNTSNFNSGCVPVGGKDAYGKPLDADDHTGMGKHHFWVKDHLNDEWSVTSTNTGDSRSQEGSRTSRSSRRSSGEGSSRSSGSRSAR